MEVSAAAVLEAAAEVDIYHILDDDENSAVSSNRLGVQLPDDCVSVGAVWSAAPTKSAYIIEVHETTPLLPKAERMASELSSPIEIAGIEGASGRKRPWDHGLPVKKQPWWDTPSVSVTKFPYPSTGDC